MIAAAFSDASRGDFRSNDLYPLTDESDVARFVASVITAPSRTIKSGPRITPMKSTSSPWQVWMHPISATDSGFRIQRFPSEARFQRAEKLYSGSTISIEPGFFLLAHSQQ